MRITLSALLCALSLLYFSGVDARDTLQHRISHRAPAPILDTCAYIDSTLSEFLGYIPGTVNGDGEDIPVQACLCASEVRTFIEFSNITIGDYGAQDLELAAEEYIVEHPGAQHCIYPPNSVPRCSPDDPCGYECTNGFTQQSYRIWGETKNSCTCPSPNVVCNGRCGLFANGCPSEDAALQEEEAYRPYRDPAIRARPSVSARPSASPSPSAAFNSYSATPTGSFYNAQAQQAQEAGCAPYETLCGAYAPRGRIATECVDTQNDLESCGGCMVAPPSPFLSYDYEYVRRDTPMGVDCTSLEAVADVSCYYGRCVVQACEVGWMVAPSGDHCTLNTHSNAAHAPGYEDVRPDGEWYAPEHMPTLQILSATSTSASSTPTASFDAATASTSTPSPTTSPDFGAEPSPSESPYSEQDSNSASSPGTDNEADSGAEPSPSGSSYSGQDSDSASSPGTDNEADSGAEPSPSGSSYSGQDSDSASGPGSDHEADSGAEPSPSGSSYSGQDFDSASGPSPDNEADSGAEPSLSGSHYSDQGSDATSVPGPDNEQGPNAEANGPSNTFGGFDGADAASSPDGDSNGSSDSGAAPAESASGDTGSNPNGGVFGFGEFPSDSVDSLCENGNLRRDIDTGVCASESAEGGVNASEGAVYALADDTEDGDSGALEKDLSKSAGAAAMAGAVASVSADGSETSAVPTSTPGAIVVPSPSVATADDGSGAKVSAGPVKLGFGNFAADGSNEPTCGDNLRRDVDTGVCLPEGAAATTNADAIALSQQVVDGAEDLGSPASDSVEDLLSVGSAYLSTETATSTDALPTPTSSADDVPTPLDTSAIAEATPVIAGVDANISDTETNLPSQASVGLPGNL